MGTAKVKSGSAVGKVQYPYDAMVYIDGTTVCAIDKEGNIIKRGVAGMDDATVIQAAINTVSQYGTVVLYGNFVISSAIVISTSCNVVGTLASFTYSSGGRIDLNTSNIKISNLYITGSVGNDSYFIRCMSDNNVIDSCFFKDTITGSGTAAIITNRYASITSTCVIKNCKIENHSNSPVGYNGWVIYCRSGICKIINNEFLSNQRVCVRVHTSNSVSIDNNIFLNTNPSWINLASIWVEDDYGDINNINITNNIFKNTTTPTNSTGFVVLQSNGTYNIKRINISGNLILNTSGFTNIGVGIYLHGHAYGDSEKHPENCIVCNNTIYGVSRGIDNIWSYYNTICNNTIENTDSCAIYIGGDYTTVSGNTIVSWNAQAGVNQPERSGIMITHDKNIVTGNIIRDLLTNGIYSIEVLSSGLQNIISENAVNLPINSSMDTVFANIGYIHISEIRDSLNNVLEVLGDVRLLLPQVEITGTTITDYTRWAHDATASVSVATWYGFQGRATYYDFNGSSHYLYRANDTDFDFGNSLTDSAFSIVVCVYADSATSRQIVGKWDVNNLREWRFFLDASGYPTLQLYDESIDKYIGRQDQTALVTTGWKVLVTTYDGSGICAGCKIYLDGVQVDDADYTDAGYVAMEAINTNLMVGVLKNSAAYSEYFDGKMTWIGVSAKELSPNEVWSLTQRLKGVLGI